MNEITFYNALKLGNTYRVKEYINAGIDVNRSGITDSPLYIAASFGYTQIVELLIKAGADVNSFRIITWTTPLIAASKNGHLNIVELLVKAGADINAINFSGQSALLYAIDREHKKIAEYLIEAGANVNATNIHGETPLFLAAINGYTDIFELLIEKGADIEAPIYIQNLGERTLVDITDLGSFSREIIKLIKKAHAIQRRKYAIGAKKNNYGVSQLNKHPAAAGAGARGGKHLRKSRKLRK